LQQSPQTGDALKRIEGYIFAQAQWDLAHLYQVANPAFCQEIYVLGVPFAYGWHFNWDGSQADVVVRHAFSEDGFTPLYDISNHVRITFSEKSDHKLSADFEIVEGPVNFIIRRDEDFIWLPEGPGGCKLYYLSVLPTYPPLFSADAPVYCCRGIADELITVRYQLTAEVTTWWKGHSDGATAGYQNGQCGSEPGWCDTGEGASGRESIGFYTVVDNAVSCDHRGGDGTHAWATGRKMVKLSDSIIPVVGGHGLVYGNCANPGFNYEPDECGNHPELSTKDAQSQLYEGWETAYENGTSSIYGLLTWPYDNANAVYLGDMRADDGHNYSMHAQATVFNSYYAICPDGEEDKLRWRFVALTCSDTGDGGCLYFEAYRYQRGYYYVASYEGKM
jgi:hypothetical protein